MSDFTTKNTKKKLTKVNQVNQLVNLQLIDIQCFNPKVNQVNQLTNLYTFITILDNSIYIFILYIYYNIIVFYFFKNILKKVNLVNLVNFFKFSTNNQIVTKIINKYRLTFSSLLVNFNK